MFHILLITGDIMVHDFIINVIFQVKWCYIIMQVHNPSKFWLQYQVL